MRHIAFFTERLPSGISGEGDPISSFAYDLARTLADLQNDVRIFSTYSEGAPLPTAHRRIEVLRPFKRWSWFEIPKMLPLLIDFRPDVLHVIQPRAEALGGLTNALSAVAALAPLLGRPSVVASFYELREEDLKKHRALLKVCSAVTVSNRPQLELMTRYIRSLGVREPVVNLMPIPNSLPEVNSTENGIEDKTESDPLNDFFLSTRAEASGAGLTVFVPGNVDEHENRQNLFMRLAALLNEFPNAAIVFGGGWGQIPTRSRHELMGRFDENGHRVFVTGPLSPSSLRFALRHSHVVLLASTAMTSLQLTQTFSEALSCEAVLILNREQLKSTAVSWRDGENAFVVDPNPESWDQALRKSFQSPELVKEIRGRLPEFARTETLDEPGNAMNRLYAMLSER